MQYIKGKEITILFDGKKCIHARNCVLSQPEVFKAGVKGDWIFPDNASAEDIAILAQICPSGAIQYERNDGGKNEAAPKVNTARVSENGPVIVRGELVIDGEVAGNRATLCRCGKSKNKPFCDGAHSADGFAATGEIPVIEAQALDNRDGKLTITSIEDGPIMIDGNVEVLMGSGKKSTTTQKLALCRCGASANKPYCDGSHVKIGFKTS
ncbi:MAG: CDGSH iron-sulfur domain-containing protein [Devosiaceae bacterium]|nr:CDGSH iron-sulfur domain-containing protein [Devosiaceae bacterium]